MNTGRTAVIGIVDSVTVEPLGHFAQVTVEPLGDTIMCRVAPPRPGVYLPLDVGTEVLVLIPRADTQGRPQEPVCIPALWSTVDPPPPAAITDPTAIHVVHAGDVNVTCAKATIEASGEVLLGSLALGAAAHNGVVRGCDACIWGGTHTVHSATVRAKD